MHTCLTQGHIYYDNNVKNVGITKTCKQYDVQLDRLNMSTYHTKGPIEMTKLDPQQSIPNNISRKRHPIVEALTGNTDRPTKKLE